MIVIAVDGSAVDDLSSMLFELVVLLNARFVLDEIPDLAEIEPVSLPARKLGVMFPYK